MNTERLTIILVGSINAGAAVLAASDVLPADLRLICAALAATCGFALASLRSWADTGPAQPHG